MSEGTEGDGRSGRGGEGAAGDRPGAGAGAGGRAADGGGRDASSSADPSRAPRDKGTFPPLRGEGHKAAERRQIEALNQLPPTPEAGAPEAGAPETGVPETGVPDEGPPGSAPPATGGGPRRPREATLLDAGHALAEATSLEEALRVVVRLRAGADFDLHGQVVFGVGESFLNAVAQADFRPGGLDKSFRMPLTTGYPAVEVARTGRAVFLSSPEEYRDRFPATWQLSARKGRGAWAFLPLTAAGRVTAVWLAAFDSPKEFGSPERALLDTTAVLLSQVFERSRANTAELALSRGLRSSMGAAGEARGGLAVATRYVPTGGGLMVGGDWYDVIDLPSGRVGLVIGDVQGHDVHAAGLMSQLRTAVHAYAAEGHGPDAILSRTSRFLAAVDEERFATCVYVEADPATGTLHVARAGHPHPVLRLPDGTCLVRHIRGGLPLGLMAGENDYPVDVMELGEGEVLMLCTDGLIETGGHDMFTGWVRLRDAMTDAPAADLEGMADRLMGVVTGPAREPHEQAPTRGGDDIALLLLRRDAEDTSTAVPERRLVLTIRQDQGEGLSEAREELRALLHDWTREDQVDTAVLLTSELLGNVLVHTDQSAALAVRVLGDRGRRSLRIEVTDRGDELPHQRAPGELASSGRGLVLLDLLSQAWGVRPEPEGKTVWFELGEQD
ncbi:SpoIIE family protein phosphatase [Streptomyces sp. NPDC049954]|uniref:SpoIIE family protein phosphatase n=1 Tax=Streptomyces sp. NPDC049954 TaxID=3155779 RepID=UPI00342FFB16